MEEETGLTRNEQETARKKLKALGILSERLAGVPATLHFKINFDALESALQTEEKSGAGGIYHHIAVTDIQHKEEQ